MAKNIPSSKIEENISSSGVLKILPNSKIYENIKNLNLLKTFPSLINKKNISCPKIEENIQYFRQRSDFYSKVMQRIYIIFLERKLLQAQWKFQSKTKRSIVVHTERERKRERKVATMEFGALRHRHRDESCKFPDKDARAFVCRGKQSPHVREGNKNSS